MTERRLQLAGVSTAVLKGGGGPPVVLLHGAGEFAAAWLRVIPDPVTTRRVVVPDLPGLGAVAAGDSPLDARRVLDRLRRLVLVDALGLAGYDPAPRSGEALHRFQEQPTAETRDGLFRQCFVDLGGARAQVGEPWEALATYALERARSPGQGAALGGLIPELGLPPIPPADLARIAGPTSLIWGRTGLQVRPAVDEAARTRSGWPLHVIDAAGDDPAAEQPQALLAAPRQALAGTEGEGDAR